MDKGSDLTQVYEAAGGAFAVDLGDAAVSETGEVVDSGYGDWGRGEAARLLVEQSVVGREGEGWHGWLRCMGSATNTAVRV
jgi:hypothetical protein